MGFAAHRASQTLSYLSRSQDSTLPAHSRNSGWHSGEAIPCRRSCLRGSRKRSFAMRWRHSYSIWPWVTGMEIAIRALPIFAASKE